MRQFINLFVKKGYGLAITPIYFTHCNYNHLKKCLEQNQSLDISEKNNCEMVKDACKKHELVKRYKLSRNMGDKLVVCLENWNGIINEEISQLFYHYIEHMKTFDEDELKIFYSEVIKHKDKSKLSHLPNIYYKYFIKCIDLVPCDKIPYLFEKYAGKLDEGDYGLQIDNYNRMFINFEKKKINCKINEQDIKN
jgi:hypothetical protein